MTERTLLTAMYALHIWEKNFPITREQTERVAQAKRELTTEIMAVEAQRMGFENSFKAK